MNWKTLRVPDQSSDQTLAHSLTLLPRRLDASIDAETGCLVGAPQKMCSSLSKVTCRFFLGELRRLLVVIDEIGIVDETLRIPRGIALSGLRLCTRLTILKCESEREAEAKDNRGGSEVDANDCKDL